MPKPKKERTQRKAPNGSLISRRPGRTAFEIKPTARFFEKSGRTGSWRLREEYRGMIGGEIPASAAQRFAAQAFAKGAWTKPITYMTAEGVRTFHPPKRGR